MESIQKLEFTDRAIQKIVAEDDRSKDAAAAAAAMNDGDEDREEPLLSKLLSEVEQLKADAKLKQAGGSAAEKEEEEEEEAGDFGEEKSNKNEEKKGQLEVEVEEMVKELRKVRRQNVITHCLLSVMIVLTVAWQLSEVSLILKLKDGLSHPFRSFGSMLTGLVKGPATTAQDGEKNDKLASKQQQAETPPIPPLKLPELPHVDLGLLNGEKDSSQ